MRGTLFVVDTSCVSAAVRSPSARPWCQTVKTTVNRAGRVSRARHRGQSWAGRRASFVIAERTLAGSVLDDGSTIHDRRQAHCIGQHRVHGSTGYMLMI